MSIISHSDTATVLPTYTLHNEEDAPPSVTSEELHSTFDVVAEDPPHYSPPLVAATADSGPRVVALRAARAPPKEFCYKITSRGKEIVTLTLFTDARHSKDAATFVGREPVGGTVRLRLDKPTTVKSITVTICGRCLPTVGYYVDTNSFSDESTFMEISRTLWSSEKDSRGPNMISGGVTRDGKLQGEYLWSFAVDVPPELLAPTPTGDVSFVPPQTFKEQYCAMVVYDILLRVKRAWPIPDYRIEAPFQYIPAISPPAFHYLRQLAYENGTPLPAPIADPEGWHALDTVQLTGTLFKSRPLDVECTLFLAKPLQYTRGAEIPLFVRFTSPNAQAVDLLSAASATAITVRLQRRIRLSAQKKSRNKLSSMALDGGNRVQELFTGVKAVWWPPTSAPEEAFQAGRHVRYVRGELRLKDALKPSSDMPYMKIEYFVLLRPFSSVTGIELDLENDKIQQAQSIKIGTLFGPGPVPKRYAPS